MKYVYGSAGKIKKLKLLQNLHLFRWITLRGWLAEALELVTSRTTFPYKNYQMITSEKFKHLKARFLGNFKFTNVQISINCANCGSNASINDA